MRTPKFISYIESDGRQYIDTDITLEGSAIVEMTAQLIGTAAGAQTLFGMRSGQARYSMAFQDGSAGLQAQFSELSWQQNPKVWNSGWRKSAAAGVTADFTLSGRIRTNFGPPAYAEYRYAGDTPVDVVHAFDSGGPPGAMPATLYLCACHDADSGAADPAHLRIYSCVIYDSIRYTRDDEPGVSHALACPVRAFFPALDGDDRPCLYDAVSDEYFYSETETDFAAGPAVDRMLLREWQYLPACTPARFVRRVEAVELPQTAWFPDANFDPRPDDPFGTLLEFVGFDTDDEPFTAVYPTYAYSGGEGTAFDLSCRNRTADVYAVYKFLSGWLVCDAHGHFYRREDDGTRTDLGEQTLEAQLFRDYAFQDYPLDDMLADLESPSVFRWRKESPQPQDFDAVVTALPHLPQGGEFPVIVLRKALRSLSIDSDRGTLWNISFDGGSTWKYWDGEWKTAAEGEGCPKNRLELLDKNDWAAVTAAGDSIRLRAWMQEGSWIAGIRADYLEDEQ